MNLSSILVAERKKKGETQQKVADALYISRQSLSNWENGKNFPDIPTLIALSNYYDFSLDIIKGDTQFMKKVERDYELINTQKANKKYAVLLAVLTIIVFLISAVLIPLSSSNETLMKCFKIADLFLCILLLHVAVKFSKVAYQYYEDIPNSPLWVPRTFGYGVSLNPYNKIGRLLTIALLIIIDLFCIGMGISTLFL